MYRFVKPWLKFKVGDRVPYYLNRYDLKRRGYIAQEGLEQAQEAPEAVEDVAQEDKSVEEPQQAPEEAEEVEEPAPVVEASPTPTPAPTSRRNRHA